MQHSRAVFAAIAEFHLASEVMRHQLHPVADPQDRDSERKDRRVGVGSAFVINAGGSSREQDSFRLERRYFISRDIEADDLRINLTFADAARDYLGVLRAEIEDENLGMRGRCCSSHG